MKVRAAAILLLMACAVFAQDPRIVESGKLLVPLRQNPNQPLPVRGASPQFTTIKHALRDLIESRMAKLDANGVHGLQDEVNAELIAAGLVCDYDKRPCPELTQRGYLEPIKVRVEHGYIIVQTGVGVDNCGFDESAYAYDLADNGWRRFWETEQTNYTEEGFKPQTLVDVVVYRELFGPPDYLVLTTGLNPWCTSNWKEFYIRSWNVRGGAVPSLVLDVTDNGMRWSEPPIHGSVGTADGMNGPGDDILVEYTKPSFVGPVVGREAVRHYRLVDDRLRRIDPIALRPVDFVNAWWDLSPPERANWTDPATQGKLAAMKEGEGGIDNRPTRRCESKPEVWQVHIAGQYFLVRWRPPFHFLMLDAGPKPFPGCTEFDPEADQFRSLFR